MNKKKKKEIGYGFQGRILLDTKTESSRKLVAETSHDFFVNIEPELD